VKIAGVSVTEFARRRAERGAGISKRVFRHLAVLRERIDYLEGLRAEGRARVDALMELSAMRWALRTAEDHLAYCKTVGNEVLE